jgi:large subunit ribosomal protein L13
MDPNDPTETYDIAKLPNTFNAARTNFKYMHSLGSQYVSAAKDGKVYHLFDASRMPFGKMCQRIAQLVSGRHKPIYKSNSAGIGDKCIVINAENMFFTGKKIFQKNLTYHTGYVGHLRRIQYKKLIKEKPE